MLEIKVVIKNNLITLYHPMKQN